MKIDKKQKPSDKRYWRSLEQLENSPEFRKFVDAEFPSVAPEMDNAWSRRNFLTLMGASMALAGLASCRRPVEKIVPFAQQPEDLVPGVPKYYATTMPFGLSAYGLLVESHEGRPTKIEGNKLHPSTLGSSSNFIQASILGMYDPDRSKAVMNKRVKSDFEAFTAAYNELLPSLKETRGKGLALLSESFASPTLARLRKKYERIFPKAVWATYESVCDENIFAGVKLATGKGYRPVFHYDKAKVILSLDADFVQTESENISAARGFIDGRRVNSEQDEMNRLYVIESVFSLTGSMADHRLRVDSAQVGGFALALAKELVRQGIKIGAIDGVPGLGGSFDKKWLEVVARDLIANRQAGLVVAGRRQPASTHALVAAINDALGNTGRTVAYLMIEDSAIPSTSELKNLTTAMNRGEISTILILGGNPVYTAPSDLNFAAALRKVKQSFYLGSHPDETASEVTWHIPQTHYLESWGDVRACDGTLGVVQPLIAPLFGGLSSAEMLATLIDGQEHKGHDLVQKTWKKILPSGFGKAWRRVLHDGVLKGSALPEKSIRIDKKALAGILAKTIKLPPAANHSSLEIVFTDSAGTFDGRFANNGWLQELPNQVTKVAWDNVAAVSPKTAEACGLANGDIISIAFKGKSLEIPITIIPGQRNFSVALELGYGRKAAGSVGNNVGFDVNVLRSSDAMHFVSGATITRTGRTHVLANTQDHNSMAERPIVREATLDEYKNNPDFATDPLHLPPRKLQSMYDDHLYVDGNQWGMAIDLNSCTGCNACSIACQSENNIPIVGKEQVHKGREMHWLRIDRYYSGDSDRPEMVHQPVGCQHCEMAPCEQVCPVAATVHSKDGLNTMVYNRCIGTRYCSNNCPYKVRRFNFFNYTNELPELVQMAQNPNVTVRSRGVMEKCTYCVQRISAARINAKKENRDIRDGEVVSACQQACPTKAIVFGDINDPASKVAKVKKQNRNYHLLAELNTRPRTSFLAKLRNPNPELIGS